MLEGKHSMRLVICVLSLYDDLIDVFYLVHVMSTIFLRGLCLLIY